MRSAFCFSSALSVSIRSSSLLFGLLAVAWVCTDLQHRCLSDTAVTDMKSLIGPSTTQALMAWTSATTATRTVLFLHISPCLYSATHSPYRTGKKSSRTLKYRFNLGLPRTYPALRRMRCKHYVFVTCNCKLRCMTVHNPVSCRPQ